MSLELLRASRRHFLLAVAPLAAASRLPAQQPDEATFSADVKVVNILASVRSKSGQLVRDLTKDDFSVLENGRPQAIKYFARETKLPLTLGLMVDTSASQEKVMDAERTASFRFLDEVLRDPKDQAFVMQFDIGILLRRPLTKSIRDLQEALSQTDTPTRKELRLQQSGGTLLFDAVVKASQDVMKKQQGRKALIVLSDGVDDGSEATVSDAVDAALRADTIIYSILFSDPGAYGPFAGIGGEGRHALDRLAKDTGGALFQVTRRQSIEQIFELIQDELRGQYNLGYVSDRPVEISEFRRIQLTSKQKGLAVQARNRYWAQR
jgi:VWFA-related protein